MMKSVFIGCGAYLPKRKVSNDELAAKADTFDVWLVAGTGIFSCDVAADGARVSVLGHAVLADGVALGRLVA